MGKIRSLLSSKSSSSADRGNGVHLPSSRLKVPYKSSVPRVEESDASASSDASGQTDQIVELMMDLTEEKRKSARLQQQLHTILDLNTETRCAAKLTTEEERQMRLKAEAQVEEANAHLAEAQVKLAALESEKEMLEVDLMEAASQILEQQAISYALQETIGVGPVPSSNCKETLDDPPAKISLQESRQWEELQCLLQDTLPEPNLKEEVVETNIKDAETCKSDPVGSAKPLKHESEEEILGGTKETEGEAAIHVHTPSTEHEASIEKQASIEQEPAIDDDDDESDEEDEDEDETVEYETAEDQKAAKKSQIIQWMDTFADLDIEQLERLSPDDKIGFAPEPKSLPQEDPVKPLAADLASPGTPQAAYERQKLMEALTEVSLSAPSEEGNMAHADVSGLITVGDFISPVESPRRE